MQKINLVLPKDPMKSNETATSLVQALFKSTRRVLEIDVII